ncbi:MAG: hypothetical protein GY870_17705 [archaeon]|nr:hypothetical protein [archaeon]
MVEILGVEVDLLSLIPAVFGACLSLYNWWQMQQPAKIVPNEIINYGLISSSYEESLLLTIPLIFHNDGANKGMIKDIKIGFKHGEEIKYLDIDGKAKLSELTFNESQGMTWEKFQENGYSLLKPTYPIVVEPDVSTSVTVVSITPHSDGIIPVGKETQCIIEVKYDKDKVGKVEFPFLLSKELYDSDNTLLWVDAKSRYI